MIVDRCQEKIFLIVAILCANKWYQPAPGSCCRDAPICADNEHSRHLLNIWNFNCTSGNSSVSMGAPGLENDKTIPLFCPNTAESTSDRIRIASALDRFQHTDNQGYLSWTRSLGFQYIHHFPIAWWQPFHKGIVIPSDVNSEWNTKLYRTFCTNFMRIQVSV